MSNHQVQPIVASSLRRILLIRKLLLTTPWICFVWQCLLSQSGENVICAFLAAVAPFCFF